MSESARPATPSDVARLAELCRAGQGELADERGGELWMLRHARPEPVEASLTSDVADPDHFVIVGCYDDAVVGYAAVRIEPLPDGRRLGVLTEIYVDPEARSVGVAEAMMDDVVAWCIERGCRGVDALALPGMRHTKNFFERFGLTARAIIVHRALGPAV